MDVKRCDLCNKEFSPKKSKQKYCSPECRIEKMRIINRWNHKLRQEEKKLQKQREEEEKRNKLTIAQINQLARENNMTYGKYLAKVEGGMK